MAVVRTSSVETVCVVRASAFLGLGEEMPVARINKLGLKQIAEALGEHHKLGRSHFTPEMVGAWASEAEGHFNHGDGCYFEIRGFDSNTGSPVEVSIGRDGYDVDEVADG